MRQHRIRYLRVLVAREARQLLRDKVALGLAFIAPVAAALIASSALGAPPRIDARVVVVQQGAELGDVTGLAQLAASTESEDQAVRWEFVDDETTAREMVKGGDAAAALIVPPADADGEPVRVVVNRSSGLIGEIAVSAAHTLSARISAAAAGGTPEPPPVTVAVTARTGHALTGPESYGPVIAVFFLFLACGFVAESLQEERHSGTLTRMKMMPVGSGVVLLSKGVMMLVVGVAEVAIVLVALRILVGAEWGDPMAIIAVTLAIAIAVACLAMFLASIATSARTAQLLDVAVALLLAVLGGNLVQLQNLPDALRTVAVLTPNGIAIRAYRDIAANGSGITDIAMPVVAILAFAFALGCLAFIGSRRVVKT